LVSVITNNIDWLLLVVGNNFKEKPESHTWEISEILPKTIVIAYWISTKYSWYSYHEDLADNKTNCNSLQNTWEKTDYWDNFQVELEIVQSVIVTKNCLTITHNFCTSTKITYCRTVSFSNSVDVVNIQYTTTP